MSYSGVAAAMCLLVAVGTVRGQDSPETDRPSATPCADTDAYSEFDFWLGSWTVHLADGTEVGKNVINKEKGGYAVVERWTSSRGNTGVSLNYYHPEANEWVQHWVGGDGSLITIRGGMNSGSMILEGTIHYVGRDQTNALRGTWTPLDDGRVRQYFEESTDGGATWTEWFEGFYTRMVATESR